MGFVKPGGRTSQILNSKNIEGENLEKDDFLVLVSGTNDVARNEADTVLKPITETLTNFSGINIIVVDIPHRFDLPDWSCLNKEIENTNIKLSLLSDEYTNAKVVKASEAGRNLHNRHGLHMNYRGKEWLAEMIAKTITAWNNSQDQSQHRINQPLTPTVQHREELSLLEQEPAAGNDHTEEVKVKM